MAGAILLPGDVERGGEARLLETASARLSADILLAPHHGSNTSSSARFITAVSPRYVIFAAAAPNRFAFPRPEVLRAYTDAGAQSFITGEEGAVEVLLTDNVESPRSYRRLHRRYWDYPLAPRSEK
jgi:competence protein ComEC